MQQISTVVALITDLCLHGSGIECTFILTCSGTRCRTKSGCILSCPSSKPFWLKLTYILFLPFVVLPICPMVLFRKSSANDLCKLVLILSVPVLGVFHQEVNDGGVIRRTSRRINADGTIVLSVGREQALLNDALLNEVTCINTPPKGSINETIAWLEYWNVLADASVSLLEQRQVKSQTRYLTFESDGGDFSVVDLRSLL